MSKRTSERLLCRRAARGALLCPSGPLGQSAGFTLIELVMVIVLLGILSVTAYVRWPTGMRGQGALEELRRAVGYTQHLAVTRTYDSGSAWRIEVRANRYTVTNGTNAVSAEYENRFLLDEADSTLTLNINPADSDLYFNGLGEPLRMVAGELVPIPTDEDTTFTVNGTLFLAVCPQTGYVVEGNSCP